MSYVLYDRYSETLHCFTLTTGAGPMYADTESSHRHGRNQELISYLVYALLA